MEALGRLGGTIMECGATKVSPGGNVAHNQCFYLALAAGVTALHDHHAAVAAEIREQKEAAVRAARPQWAAVDVIGEEIRAFADFVILEATSGPTLEGASGRRV